MEQRMILFCGNNSVVRSSCCHHCKNTVHIWSEWYQFHSNRHTSYECIRIEHKLLNCQTTEQFGVKCVFNGIAQMAQLLNHVNHRLTTTMTNKKSHIDTFDKEFRDPMVYFVYNIFIANHNRFSLANETNEFSFYCRPICVAKENFIACSWQD